MSSPNSSNRSSRQSSPSADSNNMQIFVKNVAGETTPLTIPSTTTISTLKSLIPLPTSNSADSSADIDPQSLRLIHAGRHLSLPSETLSSLSIPAGSTIHLALPLVGGTSDPSSSTSTASDAIIADASTTKAAPAKPKSAASRKPRCGFKACKEKVQPIVGDCGFCKGRFCAKHRMLESHSCEGLEDCKDEARERNREQLEKERTRPLQAL